MGAPSSMAAETYTFGSAHDGLAGFTPNTPAEVGTEPDNVPVQFWTTDTASVQLRCEALGFTNSSLLRAFLLDRSPGRSYRFEGTVTLTDGYADDNNRIGLYLFGDTPEVPDEDETGAIGLIFNTDDNAVAGSPGTNTRDYIQFRVGIDSPAISDPVLRKQTTTPYAQELFGTTITLRVDVTFVNDGTDDLIQIDGALIQADGDKTVVSASVPAAEYPGDYFGFVTRARSRNLGTEGDPRSNPWVMDYVSFSVTELTLSITPSATTASHFDFAWESREGKLYDLVSSTDLSIPRDSWDVWEGHADLEASLPANTLNNVPGGGSGQRFFAVVEKDPPPVELLTETFDEVTAPNLPADWTTGPTVDSIDSGSTLWELGTPSGVGPAAAASGANCAGTNIGATYGSDTDIWLRTPPLDLTTFSTATLTFKQFRSIENLVGVDEDFGQIRILAADDLAEIAVLEAAVEGSDTDWIDYSNTLPAGSFSEPIVIEFRFLSDGFDNFPGWYIDDVAVTAN